MKAFYHEELYRSAAVLEKLASAKLTICGAGALGANLAETLARTGVRSFRIIDMDRVEERNLSTQPYQRGDIGAFKAKMLANLLYRGIGAKPEPIGKKLDANTVDRLLSGSELVIDAFDNSVARALVRDWCAKTGTPCLHAGMGGEYAEVIWNEWYRVPSDANDDICDYPLARNLVMLTVAVAAEVIIAYLASGERKNYTLTLGDLSIRAYE